MAIERSCAVCNKKFITKPFFVEKGWAKYCSKKCQFLAQKKGQNKLCDLCGKNSYKTKTQLRKTKSGKFFCSKSCQTRWRNQLYIGDKHKNYLHGKASYRSIMVRNGVKKYCRLCKTRDERVLAVHHIDQNRKNNSVENLMYLCHNCHHLVHHYPGVRDEFMVPMV